MKAAVPEIAPGSLSAELNARCAEACVQPRIALPRKNKEPLFQPTNFVEQLNEKNLQLVAQYRTTAPDNVTELRLPGARDVPPALLSAFATVLARTRRLRQLHVSQAALGDDDVARLAEALAGNAGIDEVEIFSSGLRDAQLAPLCELIQRQPELTSLKLSDNQLTDAGMETLQRALLAGLVAGQRLRVLHLGGNPVGPAGLRRVASALQTAKTVASLGLRHMRLATEEALEPVRTLLADAQLELTDLQLRGNDLSGNCSVLCAGLRENATLRVLELQDCHLEARQVGLLAEALEANQRNALHALNMSNNTLGPNSATAVFALLVACPNMTTLTLNNAGLDSSFVTALTAQLRSHGAPLQLSGIGLSKNRLDDACAEHLAYFVGTGQLTSLDLSQNKFSGQIVQLLGNQPQASVRLRHLDLSGNSLGSTGGAAVAQLLEANRSIVRLFITDCAIPQEAFDSIAAVLTRNTSLQQMQYGGQSRNQNTCSKATRALIDERLRGNHGRVESQSQLTSGERRVKSDEQLRVGESLGSMSSVAGLVSDDFNELCRRVFSMGDLEQVRFSFDDITFGSTTEPREGMYPFLFEDDFARAESDAGGGQKHAGSMSMRPNFSDFEK